MKGIPGLLTVVAVLCHFDALGMDAIQCPPGSSLLKTVENKIKVEACVKRVKPCPGSDISDLALRGTDKTGACEVSHGKTRYQNPDGSELVLNYENGKLNGKAISHSPQKIKLSEENYKAGQKEGKQETFYPSGKKRGEDNYSSGIKQGEQISWYETGELQKHIQYSEGRPSGTWTFWHQNGHKKQEYMYGTLGWEGLYRDWYPSGKLHVAAQFLNGQLEGTYSIYYPNGKLMSERRYSKGILEGTFDEWAETGEKVASSRYQEGKFKEWVDSPIGSSSRSEPQHLPSNLSSHLKADLDGNGYIDDVLGSADFPNQTKVLLKERDKVVKEIMIPHKNLEIYSARTNEGQFGEPATVRDGLVAWGKGRETKILLYDFESETFEESSYPSDLDI